LVRGLATETYRGFILCWDFPSNLHRPIVRPQPNIDRLTQQVVSRPGQIGDLGDKLGLDPMDAGERTRGDPKRVERGGGALNGEFGRANGSRRRRRSLSTFWDMPVPTLPA
jgi:hypothetical protein